MPILRKVIKVGNSRAVTIPDDWFEYQEKVFGNDVKEVAMEVDKDTITIRPLPNKPPEPS